MLDCIILTACSFTVDLHVFCSGPPHCKETSHRHLTVSVSVKLRLLYTGAFTSLSAFDRL